jgi:hypothetical protein
VPISFLATKRKPCRRVCLYSELCAITPVLLGIFKHIFYRFYIIDEVLHTKCNSMDQNLSRDADNCSFGQWILCHLRISRFINMLWNLKVGCLHPVACTKSGSGFPSNATSVALDGNPEPDVMECFLKAQTVEPAKTRCYITTGKHAMTSLSKEPLLHTSL